MELKRGELKVYYKMFDLEDSEHNGIVTVIDDAIMGALKNLGFKMWASGYDLTNGVRDLAFDKEVADAS